MEWNLTIFVAIFGSLCVLFEQVLCQSGTQAKALRTQLFTTEGYDYRVRPQNDQSIPINVSVNYYLLKINELNEVKETLKTTGYLWITWDDDFLVWNSTDYSGITYQQWPQGDVWRPDVTLKNSYTDYKELGASSLRVTVYNDGIVTWYPFQVFQSTCSVDITYYPFDTQECSLTFGAWSYTNNEVNMQSGSEGVILDEYVESSTWDLVSVSGRVQNDDSGDTEISFILKIKRKPLNAIITLILPVIMLSILNLFVFMLPCSSGEKSGYAVTVFLAFAVFLTIVASSLPENSESVAYFSIYLIIQTAQGTLITISALTQIRASSFDNERKIPGILQFLTRLMNCQLHVCQKRSQNNKVEPLPDNTKVDHTVKKIHLIKTKKTSQKGSSHEAQDDGPESMTWEQVVNALDWLQFIVFTAIFIVSTTVCFVITVND